METYVFQAHCKVFYMHYLISSTQQSYDIENIIFFTGKKTEAQRT